MESALVVPAAPRHNHEENFARLPRFPGGEPQDRMGRAKAFLSRVREHVEQSHRGKDAGLSVCRLWTFGMDALLRGLFEELSFARTLPQGMALVALGGYGRKELALRSDVDLLLLSLGAVSRSEEGTVKAFSEGFHTLLWDLGLTVGWSVRSVEECEVESEKDHTVHTALLDARHLAGDGSTLGPLHVGLNRMGQKAKALFIEQKIQELNARRERFGDSVFLLEPNVKLGEGGLRDLEAARWVSCVRYQRKTLQGLVDQGILPSEDVAALRSARDFLFRCRNELHLLTGRKEDRLSFDLQDQVAEWLGYTDGPEGTASERFMRDYYLCGQIIRRKADAIIARAQEPRLSFHAKPRSVGEDDAVVALQGRLTPVRPEALQEDPSLLLRLFRASDRWGLPLHSQVLEKIPSLIPMLAKACGDVRVTLELKELLASPTTRGDFLFPLHDSGVLAALIPEFGRITAYHPKDAYHVYTVDVHSLFALRQLYLLKAGALSGEEKALSEQMQKIEDVLPLCLAILLHDAGKGMGGRHSEHGVTLAQHVARRMGLSPTQKEELCFLVGEHLLMSQIAQRRDLSDPKLISDFAQRCESEARLRSLLVLTYADIHSVRPGQWTDWKRVLLLELFEKALGHWRGDKPKELLPRPFEVHSFNSLRPEAAARHARMVRRAKRAAVLGYLSTGAEPTCSELCLSAKDRHGLLGLFAGTLSAHGVNILSARIVSSKDGVALDVFQVVGPEGAALEHARWRRARADLRRVLLGEVSVEELLQQRAPSKMFKKPQPQVPTRVSFDNKSSANATVVEVRTLDQRGLLYVLASSLSAQGVEIGWAQIATEGHRAVDCFYVTRGGQKLSDSDAQALCQGVFERIAQPEKARS